MILILATWGCNTLSNRMMINRERIRSPVFEKATAPVTVTHRRLSASKQAGRLTLRSAALTWPRVGTPGAAVAAVLMALSRAFAAS